VQRADKDGLITYNFQIDTVIAHANPIEGLVFLQLAYPPHSAHPIGLFDLVYYPLNTLAQWLIAEWTTAAPN
jgi:hypothetical protein